VSAFLPDFSLLFDGAGAQQSDIRPEISHINHMLFTQDMATSKERWLGRAAARHRGRSRAGRTRPNSRRPSPRPTPTPGGGHEAHRQAARLPARARGPQRRDIHLPQTIQNASAEIKRLQRHKPSTRAERRHDRREVQDALADRPGDTTRIRSGETTGYGSTAAWSDKALVGQPEPKAGLRVELARLHDQRRRADRLRSARRRRRPRQRPTRHGRGPRPEHLPGGVGILVKGFAIAAVGTVLHLGLVCVTAATGATGAVGGGVAGNSLGSMQMANQWNGWAIANCLLADD
jgi:hypothetical protein